MGSICSYFKSQSTRERELEELIRAVTPEWEIEDLRNMDQISLLRCAMVCPTCWNMCKEDPVLRSRIFLHHWQRWHQRARSKKHGRKRRRVFKEIDGTS